MMSYVILYAIIANILTALMALVLPLHSHHRVHLVVAWYDCWIGVYVDRTHRTVYVFFLPCVGMGIHLHEAPNAPR